MLRAKQACHLEVEELVEVVLEVLAKVACVVELLLGVPPVGKRSYGDVWPAKPGSRRLSPDCNNADACYNRRTSTLP